MRRIASGFMLAALMIGISEAALAQATLSGNVITDPDERPIANAEIVLKDVGSTRSDEKGHFRIARIPAGSHSVLVRLAGYEPWIGAITFEDGKTVDADFMLRPAVTRLDTVQVRATENRYALRLRDFDSRRKEGTGRFLTADVFAKNQGRRVAEILLGAVPGIRMSGNGDEKVVNSSRSARALCPVQVVLNDNVIFNGQAGQSPFDINSLQAADILGVEYYTVAETPPRFSGTGATTRNANPQGPACGTIIVWTK